MFIGELAARTGMTKDGIRFYEKAGLLEGRRLSNGYRDFPPETVEWLRYVQTAKALGFTLGEIRRHGDRLRDAPDAERELSALLQDKIDIIDARMTELAALRADLSQRVGTGCPFRQAEPATR